MGQVTSLFARKMIAAAGAKIDGPALLTSVGLDPDAPWDPKVMIEASAYYDMLESIADQIDVTDLPLKTGASMRCDDYGALGLAWKAAPNLMGSLSRVERYARIWTDVVEYEIRPMDEGILYVLHRAGPRRLGLRLSNETTLAGTVTVAREVSPGPFAPLRAFLKHEGPASADAHEAFFGCPVEFGAKHDALLFSQESLLAPNRLGDEGITQFLISHLEAELSELAAENTLEAITKDAIARALSGGLPKMADIARGLGYSARSYHRRLSEHGLSFQTLTEETRRELAEGLLRDDRYSLSEIAFLTGFSEQSSFTRAFKRWVGHTPATYRKGGLRA